ncbi:hypothetical protein OC846_005823 [Tilletia horrida]|uniref:Uncharacterized protein n=1 Tax=Tilletia horrida TaxID=155126 RepID=A0AAN6GK27_9BASI|nr:hypothetical protein OC845_005557 [Tilletia horrida]KAK0545053.1 hypothetical protein OC846_005823 [Tilletia horrida]KAK0562016.1 hypothetical protein OC861_005537 [Tilletia horrida]
MSHRPTASVASTATADHVPTPPTTDSRAAVLAALSDVVTVTDPNNSDAAPKPLPPAPKLPHEAQEKTGFGARMAGAFGRMRGNKKGRDQDGKNGAKAENRSSTRIDVIDRLDASGIHGLSLFHHDSPYDACTPHANRHGARAPVNAFSVEEGLPGINAAQPRKPGNSGNSRQNLSPLAQATLQRMNAADADLSDPAAKSRSRPPASRSRTMDSYADEKPSLHRGQSDASELTAEPPTLTYTAEGSSAGRPQSRSSAGVGMGRRNSDYINAPGAYSQDRDEPSNPLAEVWGIVPEPWQEFATPAARSGKSGNGAGSRNRNGQQTKGGLSPYNDGEDSGTPSAASSVLDMEAVLTGRTSSRDTPQKSKSADQAPVSNLGTSDGTIRRGGGRNGSKYPLDRSTSAVTGFSQNREGAGVDGDADGDHSGDYVIEAGVSPFPEPDYGGPRAWNDGEEANGAYGNGAGPKRSKSLIKRMKNARQNPNMPALKVDVSNVELGAMNSASSASPSTPSAAGPEARRMRHLSSPVLPSPGSGGGRAGQPLAPQWEESADWRGKNGDGDDYLAAVEAAEGRGRGTSPGSGGVALGRSGSLFGKFGRKPRA